jgi:hypothetical protein
MALGEADTVSRRDEVLRFFGWDKPRIRGQPIEPDIALP